MRLSLKYIYLLAVLGGCAALFWMTQGSYQDSHQEQHTTLNDTPTEKDTPPLDHKSPTENTPSPSTSTAISPVFEGVDAKGQPYTVRAKSATRDPDAPEIHLTSPHYVATTAQGTPVDIQSNQGVLNEEAKRLTLTDNVVLRYGTDNVLYVPHMDVATDTGYVAATADKNDIIHGHSPKLSLRTHRMEVYDRGKTIVMHDRPTLTFHMK